MLHAMAVTATPVTARIGAFAWGAGAVEIQRHGSAATATAPRVDRSVQPNRR